jgi:hypothetical protein
MKTNPNKLWITVIALGWLFDFLFWEREPGVNFTIFTGLCLAGAFYLLLSEGLRPNRNSLLALPFIVFFALVSFVRAEPLTAFLSYAFTLFFMSVLAVTYLGGRWLRYALPDYLARFLQLFAGMIARPIAFNLEAQKRRAESGAPASGPGLWPVVRGVVIALPVIAIFASLLASADVVFGQQLERLIELFRLENLPEYIFRLIYVLVIGYALAGVVLHAGAASADEKLVGQERPAIPAFLGFTEAAIVLGSVLLLFTAFVVVQFQYFFGGQANIHIDGYTYSDYARRGFGELVAVAFFTLLMLLALSAVTRRETELQRRIFSGLGVGLVALVLVMLVSAYQRLALYEAAYGFSRLRTYTHVFLIWIGLLLVATMALEIARRERLFAMAALAAAAGFAVSLPLLDVDAFIVRQNLARELAVGAQSHVQDGRATLDSQYFIQLSDDAVPGLVDAYRDASLPEGIRDKLGAALACMRYSRGQDPRELPWQSFHVARLRAAVAFDAVDTALDEYTLTERDWPVMVTTPLDEEYSCSPYYYD